MKRIALLIIFIFNFSSHIYASGLQGTDGQCYWLDVTVSGPFYQDEYGWYAAGTNVLTNTPGIDKAGGSRYTSRTEVRNWYRVTAVLRVWTGSSWAGAYTLWNNDFVLEEIKNNLLSASSGSLPSSPPDDFCSTNNCSTNAGKITYDLKQYDNPDSPPTAGNVCYEDCQQSAQILWNDCLAGSCVASVKYTATGETCGVETSVENLQTDPPDRCTDQINEKIAQCGGSLNVLSFDFESCTGECTPDACGDQWNALVERCGGIMAVSNWDAQTCSGSCASDPVPDPDSPDSEAVPETVTEEKILNADGTSQVTQTTVYNVDGDVYAETNTTTYDAAGNATGTTKTTSKGSGTTGTGTGSDSGSTQYFNSITPSALFSTPYNPGPFDIPTRFNTFLNNVKNSALFSFSTAFFDSIPGGGSSTYTVQAGRYGTHTVDLSDTMSIGLAVLKSILLACFGFLSIRAVIMKR